MEEDKFEQLKDRAEELGREGLSDIKTVAKLMNELGASWEEANDAVDYIWGWKDNHFKLETLQ